MNKDIKLKRYIYENKDFEQKQNRVGISLVEVLDIFQEALEMEFNRDKTLSSALDVEVNDREVYPSALHQSFIFSNEKFKFEVTYVLKKHENGLDVYNSFSNVGSLNVSSLPSLMMEPLSQLTEEDIELIAVGRTKNIIGHLRLLYKKHELENSKFLDILTQELVKLIQKQNYDFNSVERSADNSITLYFIIDKTLYNLYFRFENKTFLVSFSKDVGTSLSFERFNIMDINIHDIIKYVSMTLSKHKML